ncbi:CD1375 family protein [Brevibacillus agri]|nr:CD1375 family protein [Brevibacillus agri]MED1642176.1 CD1375 family protein [Brevibacillus agri]MED1654409.1 CD1375 family protein [Brevibacillus agri]MED1688092.1 CD1375 family protein [Brevibacillus agri]MED1691178.1 CD1375 family protein [Brevibacillus agri]MED1699414.1 CD1375 family protein [Brevibacillus agri]
MAIATIYATLILEGYKTFAQVPALIKPEVKRLLESLGYPDLAQ